ncbi:MAG: hypothetical protein AUJ92_00525 [Armatimonadetes bacterium CG2_30_59_28]|nr:MAG: hypothetical protein AUJ92_00525 [Armatimonadetes bacterium CG2_30_59_28]PIU65676.1 MAG: hypothetical protein COS85_07860 [Armatimonadetes bacterium CG07_land_8_20_14_0_80_59_28]PIY39605.1 MAG: hypothetical protein COZ05_19015 [Armatimonadetes bacterium CG_4_10_14_3_um_filter_59_10]
MAQAPGGFPLIQELVRQRKYYWSNHVGQQVDAGEFDETDLEACIRSGSVKKTERDRLGNSVGNKVYVIVGRDAKGRRFYTAGKILRSNGHQYFFITAHQAR